MDSYTDVEHLFVALSFFCVAAAFLVFFFRSGKRLKKNKAELDQIEKMLAENKPEDLNKK